METESRAERVKTEIKRERDLFVNAPLPPRAEVSIAKLRREERGHMAQEQARVHEQLEAVAEEERRQKFKALVGEFLNNPLVDYVSHVHCGDSDESYKSYTQSVRDYQGQGRLKRLFSPSPEIRAYPPGYKIARLIELYRDTIAADRDKPLRILYPASGADVAGLLDAISLLNNKNIEIVFVNQGYSQTGGPHDIVKRLESTAPDIKTNVQVKYLSDYVAEGQEPIDVFLYHTPSLNRHLSIGDEIFAGVDMEKFSRLLSDNALLLGDHRGMERLVVQHEADEFLRENFESFDTRFPVALRRLKDIQEDRRAA